jgi:hypothetical protein
MEPARDLPYADDFEFPSGPWTGYWIAVGCRFRQDLALRFAGGVMAGEGIDTIGRFVVEGRYDVESREVHWQKTYVGHHSVEYRGYREGRGIWGTWECAGRRGGFQIWPREQDPSRQRLTAEEIDLRKMLEEILPGIVYG